MLRWIIGGFVLLCILFGRWIYFQRMTPKQKLKRQLLQESKKMERLMKSLSSDQRKIAIKEAKLNETKDRCVDLVHQFRRATEKPNG